MLNKCNNCNSEYKAKTKRSKYCSDQCKNSRWYSNNKVKKKQYYLENIETIKEREKSYDKKDKNKAWYDKNGKEYYAKRRENINYRIKKNLRTRVWKAVRNNWKSGSTVDDLGCSIDELKTHLESQFIENMSWDNYGEWHIDHVQPLDSFDLTNRDEFLVACNYSNLQPLWAKDNILKSNKVE